MVKIKIKDESGDRNYFTIIPNYIANHSSANDQALYFQMKKFAGESGKCFATEQTLMKKLAIGKKSFDKALNYLLAKKWVTFIGFTQGKTRPIKTYTINNIWEINNNCYDKIPAESTVSSKDTSSKSKDTFQKQHKIHSKSNVEEEPIIIRTNNTAKQSFALIKTIIKEFILVDPKNKDYYKNTTQRKACEFLVENYSFEDVISVIRLLPKTNGMEYMPTITTPLQLKEKWVQLASGLQRIKNKTVNSSNVIFS